MCNPLSPRVQFIAHLTKQTGISMSNVWRLCLFGLFLIGSPAMSMAQQPSGEIEKAITALENQWLQSQKTNNPDIIAPLLADKFVSTEADGKVSNKAQMLADAKTRKYSSAEYEDVKVTVFGDTAIATGGFKGKGIASGKPFEEHARWTDTWVKMPSGKWQCVASQDSPAKM
jgi:ketosteroid isomerase-like protein